ncbi:substrate-binding periplasmic protein [Reinekea marinisedimentorum]|uniref:Polar amino acid transport system substrate-binding protein n=1 Tax=Reinekea marinisedimentorum TaxID=230495 RepID=A0A4V2UJM1_9GAMM|nr:transporter substrate-binding domain-containing protein [Reinekea marinisedimentorum]TCS40408.1 polar amino acid transport system substrate-binding protein [Reinekea marinisedimentorum]
MQITPLHARSFLLSLLFSVSLAAAPALASDCLRMHVIENSLMGYVDEQGVPTGAHWEFLSAIEQRSGICMEKVLLPIPRLWSALELGTVDGGIVFRSPQREQITLPVAQTLEIQIVAIPRAGLSLHSYEDLSGLNIGVTRGTQLSNRFDADESLNRVEVNSYSQLAKMMAAGHVDAIAGTLNSLTVELETAGAIESVNLAGSLNLGLRDQWLLMSRNSDQLDAVPALKQATDQLRQEGVFDRIMDKYYGNLWHIEANYPK